MTFRQQEFARHYAGGLTAVEAARASGYAASTAESNAARMLRSAEVYSLILRHRNTTVYVEDKDMQEAALRLQDLACHANPHVALSAIRLMYKIRSAQTTPSIIWDNDNPEVTETLRTTANEDIQTLPDIARQEILVDEIDPPFLPQPEILQEMQLKTVQERIPPPKPEAQISKPIATLWATSRPDSHEPLSPLSTEFKPQPTSQRKSPQPKTVPLLNMKSILTTVLLAFTLLVSQAGHAQSDKWGLGLRFGSPTAFTIKRYISERNALDINIGSGYYGFYDSPYRYGYRAGYPGFGVMINYLWRQDLKGAPGLELYYGIGGMLAARSYYTDAHHDHYGTSAAIGLTGALGLEYFIPSTPISVFVEANPYVEVFPAPFWITLGASIGGRFVF